MERIQHLFLFVHILSGCLALVFGLLILCLKKGNRTHRTNGKIFFFSLIAISISALVLSATKQNTFLFCIALFSAYMNIAGWNSTRNRKLIPTKGDWMLWSLAITNSVIMLFSENLVLLVFGCINTWLIVHDIYLFGYLSKAKRENTHHWLERHIGMMMGSFISTVTAFLVVNLPHAEPKWLIWFLPTALGVPLIVRWTIAHPLLKTLKSK